MAYALIPVAFIAGVVLSEKVKTALSALKDKLASKVEAKVAEVKEKL